MSGKPRTLKPLLTACSIAALLWISCAGIEASQQIQGGSVYETLAPAAARATKTSEEAEDSKDEQDTWASIAAANPDYVGWLAVENTTVSYPLVQAKTGNPSYWLNHDAWGSWSSLGCPYIDARTSLGSRHVLALGHHIGSTDLMFSPLAKAYRQDVFSGLGEAVITTTEGQTLRFSPLLALRVDQSFAEIQTFEWDSTESFTEWIEGLETKSGAILNQDGTEPKDIQQVLTLVTCSNDMGGLRERTLVVFAR